ncbi:MAG TPA: hypothetical protein VGX92_05490 [Pyrinomonadaceae bacterium]|nr:hypothetical protein [Pyrinomonadaceae bacterium]
MRLKRLLKLPLVLFAFLCLGGATAQAFTITRTSSPIFYVDTVAGQRGMYVSYQILNNGATSYPDVWVAIDTFTGGVVSLAPREDGIVQLGPMAPGQMKTAYFYIQASGATTVDQSHTVRIYGTRPPTTELQSATFTQTDVENTIQANANKITTTISGPNPPGLGGIVNVEVTGHTGTIGSQNLQSFTPACDVNWAASSYQLVTTTIVFTGGNNVTYTDQLYVDNLTSPSDTGYVVTYSFRAVAVATAPETITPMVYIASGTNIKHTQGDPGSISPAANALSMTKLASPTPVYAGATVTYTLRLNNTTGAYDATVEDFVDSLPTTPASPSYITGSSAYNGVSVANPSISGTTLTWVGSFVVPAGQTRDLTFQVTFPATTGVYTNRAVAHVGATQIDSTLSTSDNSPATAAVTVRTPPDIKLTKTYSANTAIVQSGTELTYTIVFNNQGDAPATSFTLFDMIPANTELKLGSLTYTAGAGGVPAPTITYSNAARSAATPPQPPTPWVAYTPPGLPGTYDAQVTYIRWAFTGSNINSGNSGTISFIVRIR